MANGRNPKRKGHDTSRDQGGFVALPWSVLDCPAYARLSVHARALLLELARQFVRDNNGRLLLSRAYMQSRGWKSVDMLTKAKAELMEAGFIFQTVMGHRPNKASWYAVTWRALDKIAGFDPGAIESFERGAYRNGQSLKIASLVPPHGTERPTIGPPHGTGKTRSVPPHGPIEPTFSPLSVPPHGHHLEMPSVGFELPASADTAVMERGNGKVTVTDDAKVAPRIGDYQRLQHCGDGFQLFSGLGLIDRWQPHDIEFGRFIAKITGKTNLPPAKSTRASLTLAKQAQQAAIDRTTKKPKDIEDLVGESIRVRDAESLPAEWEAM